ncbi:MAG: flagellin [Pseudomonadota bacterium]
MTTIGAPTLLTHLRLSGATAQLRREAETARTEVVTGRIADLPKGLGRSIGDAHLLRKAIDDIALQREGIARADLRASVAQQTLADISSGGAALNADLAAALGRGDETAIAVASVTARDALAAAFSRLNVRVEGLSLFAGDAADQNALGSVDTLIADISGLYAGAANPAQLAADLDIYFNDPAGGFRTAIYLGGAGTLASIEITRGETVAATVRADEQGVKDLLRGLVVIAVAGADAPSVNRDAALTDAGTSLLDGSGGILDIRTRIGVEEQRIAAAQGRLDAEEPVLTEAYNAITSRDPYEAASRLQGLEAQIEASYVLASRLSNLSLANYL